MLLIQAVIIDMRPMNVIYSTGKIEKMVPILIYASVSNAILTFSERQELFYVWC